MKFKRRHGEFKQRCVLSESYTTDALPPILSACRQPLLPACVFVTRDIAHHPKRFFVPKICSWTDLFVMRGVREPKFHCTCMPPLKTVSIQQASTHPSFHSVHVITTRIKPRQLNVYNSQTLPIAQSWRWQLALYGSAFKKENSYTLLPLWPRSAWHLNTSHCIRAHPGLHRSATQHAVNRTAAPPRFTAPHCFSATRH
jgi:hypothetical protein